MPTVAVIGGGPSGLVSAKEARDARMDPTVFEKADTIGGLWRGTHGKTWASLRTNLSKFTCAFSDLPWDSTSEAFPLSGAVARYLNRYAQTFGLYSCIKLNVTVTRVTEASGCYQVEWLEGGLQHAACFDYVIVATGIFSIPHAPSGLEGFGRPLVHASEFRDATRFKELRVLVVGAAFSGADIAAAIARVASHVTLVASATRPHYYLPRYVDGQPIDLVLYSRAASDADSQLSKEQQWTKRHGALQRLGGQLAGLPPPRFDAPPFVAVSDDLRDAMGEGRISVTTSRVREASDGLVVFEDGSRAEYDTIVTATGYRTALDFLSPPLQRAVEWEPSDWLQPLLLHRGVWPAPTVSGLAFVGMYRGPFFAVMELQARWACAVFSARLPRPSHTEIEHGLDEERAVRRSRPRPQFPHGDYVTMADDLARRIGAWPAAALENSAHPLHSLLRDGPLLPFHFRLEGHHAKPRLAEEAIRQCARLHPFSLRHSQRRHTSSIALASAALAAALVAFAVCRRPWAELRLL